MRAILVAGAVFLLTAAVCAAAVPSGLVYDSMIYDQATNQTTFWYSIWPTSPAVSHVVIGMCGNILSVSWSPTEWGYDPTTQMTGLKLDNLPELQAPLAVSVIMAGKYSAQEIPWRLKAGTEIRTGTTTGPKCGANAVVLTGLRAQGAPWWTVLFGMGN